MGSEHSGRGTGRRLASSGVTGICMRAVLRACPARAVENNSGSTKLTDDPKKVWPSGLTIAEAEEVQTQLVLGTRVFGGIALLAHFLAAAATPWLG